MLQDPLSDAVATLWLIFEPLLFGLIGAEVDIAQIDGSTVGMFFNCKFGNFRRNFIFANNVKRYISDVNSCEQDLIYLYQ